MIHTTLKSWKNRHSINELNINEGFIKTKLNSHKWHNNECDILEGRLNDDTFITYGIYIKDSKQGERKKGDEFMEIYTGSNYNVGSSKKSHSRVYVPNQIPAKYKSLWLELKSIYDEKYKGKEHIKESVNKINEEKSIEDISFDMYNNQIIQNWVNDIFSTLEENNLNFTENDVLLLTNSCIESLKEEIDNNIQSYFHPDTL